MADRISELEAELKKRDLENESLLAELEEAREKARTSEEGRRSILLMLEDLNEATSGMERAKKEWEATFDSISDPLFIHDKKMMLVRVNRAYLSASGEAKFKDIIGRPYFEVFPKMDGPFQMCLKARELQEEEEQEEEFSCPLTDRVFKVRFYPIRDVSGVYLYSVHIVEDITEAKRAEERIKQEMEITSHLLMISEATAHTTDMDKLMGQVVHCSYEIIGCDICLSYLWDNEANVFRPSQAHGLSSNLIPLFKTESLDMKIGFVKEAMNKRGPVAIQLGVISSESGVKDKSPELPTPDSQPFPWLPDVSTVALIPLIGRKGPLGMIAGVYVETPRRGVSTGFTELDIKVMKGISHQVSTALEEARLFKESVDRTMELSHKIETIKTMHEIDRSILSTLEPHQILETTVRMIPRVVPCDGTAIILTDREKKGFVYSAGFGLPFVSLDVLIPFADTIATEVMETVRPQYIPNLKDIKGLLPLEEGLLREGFLSHVRLPLIVKSEVAGILTVESKRPSAFTPEDLSTMEKLAYQMGVALENARLIKDLEQLFIGTVKSLSSAIDAKSPWTAGHSERVTRYAIDIAKEMGIGRDEMRSLELAGLLHDVGKIGTYDFLLDKPAKLEPDELEIVRMHPVKGAAILEPIRMFRDIIPAIRHHHEFYDGTGYPDRRKGEDIPLLARILAVADTYDAMRADRSYRPGRSMEFIINEFRRCSGTQFDPKVTEAFLSVIGREEVKMAAS